LVTKRHVLLRNITLAAQVSRSIKAIHRRHHVIQRGIISEGCDNHIIQCGIDRVLRQVEACQIDLQIRCNGGFHGKNGLAILLNIIQRVILGARRVRDLSVNEEPYCGGGVHMWSSVALTIGEQRNLTCWYGRHVGCAGAGDDVRAGVGACG
jgi:hypothetical protein